VKLRVNRLFKLAITSSFFNVEFLFACKSLKNILLFHINCGDVIVKFGSIDSHSPMRGHMGHPEASQGDLENQPVL
jgi:hypothetical protein